MDKGYNLDNLEASFKEYLLAGKTPISAEKENQRGTTQKKGLTNISVKNYLSDLRHFLGWLTFHLKAENISPIGQISAINLITSQRIEEYKSYLLSNSIPVKTINRRLSTVRKFCSFCISQGWLKENPAKHVGNVPQIPQIKNKSTKIQQILEEFQKDLQKENLDQPTIKSYLDDIREFLSI